MKGFWCREKGFLVMRWVSKWKQNSLWHCFIHLWTGGTKRYSSGALDLDGGEQHGLFLFGAYLGWDLIIMKVVSIVDTLSGGSVVSGLGQVSRQKSTIFHRAHTILHTPLFSSNWKWFFIDHCRLNLAAHRCHQEMGIKLPPFWFVDNCPWSTATLSAHIACFHYLQSQSSYLHVSWYQFRTWLCTSIFFTATRISCT